MTTSVSPVEASNPEEPPALSVQQIDRSYGAQGLIVKPICWTDRHLEVLRCTFGEPRPSQGTPPPAPAPPAMNHLNGPVRRPREPRCSFREDMEPILKKLEGSFTAMTCLAFYYNGRVIDTFTCYSLSLRADPEGPCIAAYIDQKYITLERRSEFKISRRRRRARPVTPKDPYRDPYILALLIAVAQDQQFDSLERHGPHHRHSRRPSFPSMVLLYCSRMTNFYLYKANIPTALLAMLNDPSFVPQSHPSVSIDVTVIPRYPMDGLSQRLFAEMLPPSSRVPIVEQSDS